MLELSTFGRTHIDTVIGGSDIEVSVLVQTNLTDRRTLFFGNEVFLGGLAIVFDQSMIVGNNPDMALLIFLQRMNGHDVL